MLGTGVDYDGVWQTDINTAIKFFSDIDRFERGLEVYLSLRASGTKSILGHRVPRLIRWDEGLMAIEMSIVRPPFLLDFAAAKTEVEVAYLEFDEAQEAEHLLRVQ